MAKTIDIDTGDPCQNLANAIITQAATDWRKAVEYLSTNPPDGKRKKAAEKEKAECEEFFLSERFEYLTDLDGKYLLERLRKEVNECETKSLD